MKTLTHIQQFSTTHAASHLSLSLYKSAAQPDSLSFNLKPRAFHIHFFGRPILTAPSSDSVLRPQSPRNRCFDLERRRFCLCNLDPARNSHREQERDSEKRTIMISDGVKDDDLNNLRDAFTLERRDGNVWGSTSFPTSASSSEFIGERRLSMYRSCFKLKLMEKLLGRRLGSQHKGFHGSLYGFHSQTPDQIVVAIDVDKDMEVFL